MDWTSPIITTNTAATVEVDVMPFLGEADWGGPYKAYHAALANLGAEYVRFAPWFANPRVVVPELTPHVCDATHPSTNWNSTYFDGVMADFQSAVCGPEAATGVCKLSVVQQLSTMPEYMCKHRGHPVAEHPSGPGIAMTLNLKPRAQPRVFRPARAFGDLLGDPPKLLVVPTPASSERPAHSSAQPPCGRPFGCHRRRGWRRNAASDLPVEHHVSL